MKIPLPELAGEFSITRASFYTPQLPPLLGACSSSPLSANH
jgi:hypothetical protein